MLIIIKWILYTLAVIFSLATLIGRRYFPKHHRFRTWLIGLWLFFVGAFLMWVWFLAIK